MKSDTESEDKLFKLTNDVVEALNKVVANRRGRLHCGKIHISLHVEGCAWALEQHPDRPEVAPWTTLSIRERVENSLSGQGVVHDGIVVDTSRAEMPERFRISLQWEKVVYDGPRIVVSVS
jgi:hypothetical protein